MTDAPSSNPLPKRLVRVVSSSVGSVIVLGRPDAEDVFVTAAEDVRGLSASEISERLTIPASPAFIVIEFALEDIEGHLASPIRRRRPGFIGGGRTAGGAREFAISNQPVPSRATLREVKT